jgi:amidohydrolase
MPDTSFIKETFEFLHNNPETAFKEHKTTAFIAERLKEWGFELRQAEGMTGLAGILDSGKPGITFGIRADIDALPFEVEGKAVAYHACGHDAHTTMALAAAKTLSEEGLPKGRLMMVFEPAEEVGAGAKAMLEAGLLEGLDELVAFHIRPAEDVPFGKATPRLYFTASSQLGFKLTGKVAHGARPHLGINAVDAGVLAVNGINAIKGNPAIGHSVKVTRFVSMGSGINSIPGEVELGFDLRCQDDTEMERLRESVKRAVKAAAEAVGCTVEITRDGLTRAGEYDEGLANDARAVIAEVLGEENVVESYRTPGGEDFNEIGYQLGCKTCYMGLGTGAAPGLHLYGMQFNHDALPIGADVLVRLARKRLSA